MLTLIKIISGKSFHNIFLKADYKTKRVVLIRKVFMKKVIKGYL